MSLPSSSPSFMPTAFSHSTSKAAHPTTTTRTAISTRRRLRKRRARWKRSTGILGPILFPHAFLRLNYAGTTGEEGNGMENDRERKAGMQEIESPLPQDQGISGRPYPDSTEPTELEKMGNQERGDGCPPVTKGRGANEGVKSRTCKREDGKGWRCGNEAKPGSTFCEHHLSQVRSYSKRPTNNSSKRCSALVPGGGEGWRKQPIIQSSSTTSSVGNDCYYYYYTGFGPAWRETNRKRVLAIAENDGTDEYGGGDGGGGTGAAAAAAGGGCGVNGEGGENGGKGKIKGRKRVKCRSLKSLM